MTGKGSVKTADHGGPWNIKYRVWEKSDDACADREGGHTGDKETFTGFSAEPTPIDVINSILYDMRGTKSRWELAYIDEIESVDGGRADSERYVCMPCREMVPDLAGEITVPGGTKATVWCPWCGDKMEQYEEEIHG